MPVPLQGLTISELLYLTYTHFPTRFTNADRDFVRAIEVKKVTVYDGKKAGKARTKFVIRSQSTPQYHPYYRPLDSRGRKHQTQRTVRHQYDVIVQLDKLSVNVPVKVRTGSDCSMIFGKGVRAQFDKKGRLIHEDKNVVRGRNYDFFMKFEWVLFMAGSLYGRNWAGWPPNKTNPHQIPGMDKHLLMVVKFLINKGVFSL